MIAGVALLAPASGARGIGLLTYTFSAFVLASIVLEFVRGTAAEGARQAGWACFSSPDRTQPSRYGGYIVHASIVLLAIGIAGSSAYQTMREPLLRPGQSMTVAGYTLVLPGFQARMESNHRAIRALVDVYRGDKYLGRYRPGKNSISRRIRSPTRSRFGTTCSPAAIFPDRGPGEQQRELDLKAFRSRSSTSLGRRLRVRRAAR